jgi:hypothetical protein
MLPSGNDAATVVAENLGGMLAYEEKGQFNTIREVLYSKEKLKDLILDTKNPIFVFQAWMNKLAKELGLISTFFCSPTGLINKENVSNAYDLGRLCCVAMRSVEFRAIVNCISHECTLISKEGDAYQR